MYFKANYLYSGASILWPGVFCHFNYYIVYNIFSHRQEPEPKRGNCFNRGISFICYYQYYFSKYINNNNYYNETFFS